MTETEGIRKQFGFPPHLTFEQVPRIVSEVQTVELSRRASVAQPFGLARDRSLSFGNSVLIDAAVRSPQK